MKKDHQINIRVDDDESEAIEEIIKATGQTKSALLRKYLKLGIAAELKQVCENRAAYANNKTRKRKSK